MLKVMTTKFAATASLILVALSGIALTPASAEDGVSSSKLTTIGEHAFTDLSTCLTSGKSKALDVMYLVDESMSLAWTDKTEQRTKVLSNSVAQLENFANQGITVHYSAAMFSDVASLAQPWQNLKTSADFDSASKKIQQLVNNKSGLKGATDWEAGLTLARNSLADRDDESCKMLIWFTDGGISPVGTDAPGPILNSLKNLCHADISSTNLTRKSGNFGVFADLRKLGVSIFGVLYQNDASTLEHFEELHPGQSKKYLSFEHYRMSFMVPLVEGYGVIQSDTGLSGFPNGKEIYCAPTGEGNLALPGQPNGAFLNAQDPVDLAFQFLKMEAQISGGSGKPIVDGKFKLPEGTAAFRIVTTANKWSLKGPDSSKVSVNANSTDKNLELSSNGGVQQIDYRVGDDSNLIGEWKFDSSKGNSALFIYSGLTLALDRDRTSQVVSERKNTLTGRVVRTSEFQDLAVNLAKFPDKNISLSTSDQSGNLKQVSGLNIALDNSGQFKVEGLIPGADQLSLDIWLTLKLSDEFADVTSRFRVDVVSKANIATATADVVKLTNLVGPKGKAKGELTVVGPTSIDSSQYCLAGDALRTDDAQTGIQKVDRQQKFRWAFNGKVSDGTPVCFDVAKGSTLKIRVEATNPQQADGHVVSIRSSKSQSGAANLDEYVRFEFDTQAESNSALEAAITAILLLLGILIPLVLLYLMNWLTTKFLPLEQTVQAQYPVTLVTGGPLARILDKDGKPIKVEANDFKFIVDSKASRSFGYGQNGESVARTAKFPLSASWFEHQVPAGKRVISSYNAGVKSPKLFASGLATEVSPNHADNWLLVLSDAEFAKPVGETMLGTLIVNSRMAGLKNYQARVDDISGKPGINEKVSEIKDAIVAGVKGRATVAKAKAPRKSEQGSIAFPVPAASSKTPEVPGVSAPQAIPGVSNPGATPNIPGVTPPPSI